MKVTIQIIICTIFILSISSNSYCEVKFKCGEEYRFITKDSIKYQGDLDTNDGSLIKLNDGTVIDIGNIKSAYLVKRHSTRGFILGSFFGTLIGGFAAKIWDDHQSHGFLEFHFGEIFAITLSGTIIGGVTGTLLGHYNPGYQKIKIGLIPICSSRSGNITPPQLKLTYTF